MGGRQSSSWRLMIKLVWPLKQLMWNRLFLAKPKSKWQAITGKRTKEQLSQEHHSSLRGRVFIKAGHERQQSRSRGREVHVQLQKPISHGDGKCVPFWFGVFKTLCLLSHPHFDCKPLDLQPCPLCPIASFPPLNCPSVRHSRNMKNRVLTPFPKSNSCTY